MQNHVIGNYEVIEKIGEGGMGEVFLGKDLLLEREVAIKSLRPELCQRKDVVERFRTEAMALARLNHPNIATLYNYIIHDNQYYMVLEFVRGERLDSMITRRSPLPCMEVLAIIGQVLEGLEHAHRLGIVHRDIKTSNIMVTSSGRLKIMDFGIARILQNTRLTRTGQLIGTLEYMSPEQIKGLETDARTDVYSTGIVAYELLTGRVPFQRGTDYEIIKAQIEEQPMDIKELRPDVPDIVVQTISLALEKDPEKRYASAQDFLTTIGKAAKAVSEDPNAAVPIRTGPETRILDSKILYDAFPPPAKDASEPQKPRLREAEADSGRSWGTVFGNKPLLVSLALLVLIGCIAAFMKYRHAGSTAEQAPVPVASQESAKPESMPSTVVSEPSGSTIEKSPAEEDSGGHGAAGGGANALEAMGNMPAVDNASSEFSKSPEQVLENAAKPDSDTTANTISQTSKEGAASSQPAKDILAPLKPAPAKMKEKSAAPESANAGSQKTTKPTVAKATNSTAWTEDGSKDKASSSVGHYAVMHANQYSFKLIAATKGGDGLNFKVMVTNEASFEQYLAFYDQPHGYERSSVTTDNGQTFEVDQVFLWKNNQKIPALDAYRGLSLAPNETITVELVFKDIDNERWDLLKIEAYSAIRYVGVYKKWVKSTVAIKNS